MARDYRYIFCIYIEKATASAADLLDPRLACLDAWRLGCFFGHPWATFGHPWATFGHPWATFGHPWATFGHPWGPFSYLVPTLGRGLGALDPLAEESLEKGSKLSEMETQSEYIFDDILNFLGK